MVIRALSEMEPRERGVIFRVGGRGEIRRRLLDMGVVTGTEVMVKRVAPLGDPVEVSVKGYDLALRKEEAEKIQVQVTEGLLSWAGAGEKVIIKRVRAGWGLQRRLADLGLTPGVEVTIISSGRPGQVVISIRGSRLALGRGVASKIVVRGKVSGEG